MSKWLIYLLTAAAVLTASPAPACDRAQGDRRGGPIVHLAFLPATVAVRVVKLPLRVVRAPFHRASATAAVVTVVAAPVATTTTTTTTTTTRVTKSSSVMMPPPNPFRP